MAQWTSLSEAERLIRVHDALLTHEGNVTRAAKLLGIHRTQLSQFISAHETALNMKCAHCGSRLKKPRSAA